MTRAIWITLPLLTLLGCSPNPKTPDQIRQDAANLTTQATREAQTAAQDAKAAVQGIQDGVKSAIPLNLNTASETDLETLPGVGAAEAAKIISNRPYNSSDDLVSRHLMSQAAYDRISSRVMAH